MPQPPAAVTYKALESIDIGIIAVYFIIIFAIGVYFSRRERTSVGLLPGRPQRRLVRHRRIAVRLEHLHRALHRPGRLRAPPRASRSATSSGSRA